MAVFRVTNPDAFDMPALRELMLATIEKLKLGDPDKIIPDLKASCTNAAAGIFVGADDALQLRCVLAVFIPTCSLMPAPQFYCAFNKGKKALFQEVLAEAVKFVKDSGYNTIWAFNGSGKEDRVYTRALGLQPKPVGSMLEYRIA